MSYILLFLAILCGLALVLKISTGTMEPIQIAGAAIILLAFAVVAPADLNWRR